jgi:hypothetical protein
MALFFFLRVFTVVTFRISKFFGQSITEEKQVVKMRIWCIKIGIVGISHLTTVSRPLLVDCKSPKVYTAK